MKALQNYLGRRTEAPEPVQATPLSPYRCYAHGCPLNGVFAEGVTGTPRSVCWVHDGQPYARWPTISQATQGMGRWFRLYDLIVTQEGRFKVGIEQKAERLIELADKAARELGEPRLAFQESDYLVRKWTKDSHGPIECLEPSWYRYVSRLRKLIKEKAGATE